ncbi:cytochrome b5 reductase 4 isoform X2 [Stigmatopora nigra]
MLNIPSQSFPAPSSQQRAAQPGQSGRIKVALKPGHSLMDWIRFSKSGKDLTGLRGRLIEVSNEELQKHNSRNDCWTSIRGMVYNVTPYMDYHPGGEDELMKAAGIDGTDLFEQVLNAGCTVVDLKDGIIRVEVLLGKMSYVIHLRLSENVYKDIAVQTAFSVGKIQVTIYKEAEEKWSSCGQPLEFHDTFLAKKDRGLFFRDCVLVSKTELNHNTHMFQLQLPSGSAMHVPVGAHVYFKSRIHDIETVRPYTPVDQGLSIGPNNSSENNNLSFMIKIYPNGVLTRHLNSLCLGDHISVSGPHGTFSLRPLHGTTVLYFLAAGTGFTPMSRLIRLALQEITTIRKTLLLFFNRQEADIFCRRELDELTANEERFQVEHILSEPRDSWTGRKGRVDNALIKDFLSRPKGSKCYVCVCGPTLFTEQTIRMVKQQGFSEEEFHAFQG